MFKNFYPLYAADAGGGNGGNDDGSDGSKGNDDSAGSSGNGLTFETWREKLPDDQKALIESHVKGLKSALDSERGSRKDLEKQLRDLAKKAEKGSEAETQLTKLADDLHAADRKASFYEAAHAAGVKNLKLAYITAVSDELFDKQGRADFDEMKKIYPELFGSSTTPARGNAGSGTNQKLKSGETMDDFIRQKLNR